MNDSASVSVNRAKTYQLVLFPLNNGATNVYYVLVLSYIATFGSKVLALSMLFASVMVTGMRLFDAITDPIIGALMDRTNGKFGKFRHWKPDHGSQYTGAVLPYPAHPRQRHGAALRCLCRAVRRVGHRLHLPDQLHPLRPDRFDQ